MQGKCPFCGVVGDIVSVDVIEAFASINEFTRDEHGELTPLYSGDTEVLWDTQRPLSEAYPYLCDSCRSELSASDIILVEDD